MNFSLDSLNKEQQEAVTTVNEPLLLLAGAGSGKTRVITHRIAYLILEKQIFPYRILALTFTNKAAKEMKDRVISLLNKQGRNVQVSTFHSLCVLILRKYIDLLGYGKDFIIFDTNTQQETFKRVIQESEFDEAMINDKALFYVMMQAKTNGQTPNDFLSQTNNPEKYELGTLYKAYQETMKACNAIDFEDILQLTYTLFQKFPQQVDILKDKYHYIMVDEYQDTNRIQYQLVKILSEKHNRLCVVGDDDQSIYGWRGADIRNILDFQKDFPTAKVIRLEQNYRSTSVILNAANQVITNNQNRMEKSLWTSKTEGEPIQWVNELNQNDEMEEVVTNMQLFKAKYNKKWSDFAFLYRSHYHSRAIEETLRYQNIPYQMIGSLKFFDRKEIRSCLAYLYFLHNPHDDTHFLRVINFPKRGVGGRSIEKISQARIGTNQSLFTTLEEEATLQSLSPTARNSCQSFIETIRYYHTALETKNFAEVFSDLFEYINLRSEIEKEEKNQDVREQRVNNYYEFLNTLDLYAKKETQNTLADFLEYIALFTDTDELDSKSDRISLMTVHAAKGLEFPCVAIVNLVEDAFPSKRSVEEDQLEEERRLFYVAITRAKEKLILSMPKTKFMYGEWIYNRPSCFLSEIDAALFDSPPFEETEESLEEEAYRRSSFFNKWRNPDE